jgi:hypothetical protein
MIRQYSRGASFGAIPAASQAGWNRDSWDCLLARLTTEEAVLAFQLVLVGIGVQPAALLQVRFRTARWCLQLAPSRGSWAPSTPE